MRVLVLGAPFPPAIAGIPSPEPPRPREVATLSGTVTDTAGTPLPLVRVAVLEANRSTTADSEGHYTITGLPTGTYAVSFALVGYAPQVRRVTLRDREVTLNVTMRPTLIELQELQV